MVLSHCQHPAWKRNSWEGSKKGQEVNREKAAEGKREKVEKVRERQGRWSKRKGNFGEKKIIYKR